VQAALDCDADALIFLDDDEWPSAGWLEGLIDTWQRTGADIVLGPTKAVLPEHAPQWAHTSRVFDKDRNLADGAAIRTAYSYNTLLSRRTLDTLGASFDPAFRYTGASDHHYFKQAAEAGLRSVWSSTAVVYERVDPARLRLAWVLKRGYRIGAGVSRSMRLRLPRLAAVGRTALLTATNLAYATGHVLGTAHPRLSWVEGLRRAGIAAGLIGSSVYHYEEYRRDD